MSAIALPASAATGSGEMYASLNGGPTVSNTSVRKSSSGSYAYTAKPYSSGGWSSKGDEWVYFRGRSSSGAQATGLHHRAYYGSTVTGTIPYLSGYGTVGTYYKLAIEYDNDNPYKYVDLYVNLDPVNVKSIILSNLGRKVGKTPTFLSCFLRSRLCKNLYFEL